MFKKLTSETITNVLGEGWEYLGSKNCGFSRMVEVFKETPVSFVPMINHALAQYFAKRFLNHNREVHGDSIIEDAIKRTCLSDLSFLVNNSVAYFIVDVDYIINLACKYAVYFDTLTYHEAFPIITDSRCYGFDGMNLSDVMPYEIYAMLSNNSALFSKLQNYIIIGFKALKASRED